MTIPSYTENDTFISINEGIYFPYGYLNILETAELLSTVPTVILSKLSILNIVYLLTSHYTKYAVVRVNKQAVEDGTIRLRPTINDRKECPFQQILLSSELIELIKRIDSQQEQEHDPVSDQETP